MRRMAGSLLIGLAVLGAVGAVLMAGASVVEMRHTYPTSDRYAAAEGTLLLAGGLLGLEAIVFLIARQLRRPRPDAAAQASGNRRHGGRLPLTLYLGGSVALGVLPAAGPFLELPRSTSLAFLIGQPTFVTQILLGGVLGLKIQDEAARQVILVVSGLLYFAAFLYPVYSMVVMDRAVEIARYRRLKTILILFGSVHLLIGLAFAAVLRA